MVVYTDLKGKIVNPPKPPNFPMKFKECLRRVIRGRLHADRLHLFRRFWTAQLKQFENMDYASLECIKTAEGRLNKANEMIAKFTRDGVEQYEFNSFSSNFPKWRKENKIQQCRSAANRRWQKEKRQKQKKSLGRRKNQRK